eukprot:14893636-Heterocapsa_arctica.AAC.1
MRGIEGQCSAGARAPESVSAPCAKASALDCAAVARAVEEQPTTCGSLFRATAGHRAGRSAVGSALHGRSPANPRVDARRGDLA